MRAARLPSLLFATACLFAAFHALRFAYADFLFQTGTPQNIQRAADLVPSNPTYAYRSGNLQRAVKLNPYLSPAWIELAQAAEESSQLPEAERLFLQAAKVDQTFPPRWSLANFYFRRQQPEPFWHWLRLAAERSYGDRSALFRLAWRFTSDSTTILTRSILPSAEYLGLYLDFLTSENQWDAAVEAARHLAPIARPPEKAKLLDLCEALLKVNRTTDAVRVWNLWDPGRKLDAAAPLTNAGLATEPTRKGFDWRFPWREGVSHHWFPLSREIRITLDGRQAERTELLEQFLPVFPNTRYQFRFHYHLDRIPPSSGIRWTAACPPKDSFAEIPLTATGSTLTVPPSCSLLRFTLLYQRASGTVRPEGEIFITAPFHFVPTR